MSKVEDEVIETTTEEVTQDEPGQDEVTSTDEKKGTVEGEAVAPEAEDDGNEVTVSIGEPDPQVEEERKAPQWVKDLRKTNRELHARTKELEAKLNAQATENKPVVLGQKPTIEDFDFDAEEFGVALEGWFEKKNRVAQEEQRRKDEAKAQEDAWQAKLTDYGTKKAEVKVKDFEDAEKEVQSVLSVTQQGIVLQGAENAALVVYALGKNPTKAKELSGITDPVKFAFAVAKLEAQLKVTEKKPKPEPERVISGTGRTSGSVDSTLERLREEAAKTGDYTKVKQYNQSKRNK